MIVSSALRERRQADDDLAHRGRLVVDPVHQDALALVVVEGERELLGVLEHVAAEVEDHPLVDRGRQVLVDGP